MCSIMCHARNVYILKKNTFYIRLLYIYLSSDKLHVYMSYSCMYQEVQMGLYRFCR